jgi:hypothetical protein
MRSAIASDEPHSLQPKLEGLVSLPRRDRSRIGSERRSVWSSP